MVSSAPVEAGRGGHLSVDLVHDYHREGCVVVRAALDTDRVALARAHVLEVIAREKKVAPVSSGEGAYGEAFDQYINLGQRHAAIRALTHDAGLAALAAELMGVRAVRLFTEDLLIKPPGAAPTPWHQDASVFPMEHTHVITAWIPLQEVAIQDGGMRVARGSHTLGLVGPVAISEETHRRFDECIAREGLAVVDNPTLGAGDVHFHSGYAIHGAAANDSASVRVAFALHYFADGARITAVHDPWQRAMLRLFAPNAKVGDRAESPAWPLLFSED